ncbi:MAG: D-2-hydroxyacid dehydrogenase [Gammaproteobacteria bacterium]|nr:hydroxyacid dehydrogenase [Gammaproteobacteria bacterium]
MKSIMALVLAFGIGASAVQAADSVKERYQLEESRTPVRERTDWRPPQKILIVGGTPQFVEELRTLAPEVRFVRAESLQQARSLVAGADAIVGSCAADLIAAAESLRWIQVWYAGVEDCVAVPALRERKILLTNMQRIMGPTIAEHAIAMMLALTRGLDTFIPLQRERSWQPHLARNRLSVVQGKTMLVVGLGGIGTEIAKRAHALGMRVIATRASGRAGPEFVSYVGLPDELLRLAGEADVVVNAVPLTPQTTHLFDAEFFGAMKPSAYFINVARGKSVVTDALVEALKSGKLAGAGLDVTDPEPLPADHPLWTLQNVVITPHISASSNFESSARLEVVKENVRRYVAGERMLSVVDVEKGY